MIFVKDINKSFNNNQVLRNVNLAIEEGDIFGIVGHSGAGKSTLLRCLNGLETYENGSITVMDKEIKDLNSKEIRSLRKNLGMIFQGFNLMNTKNVYANIALPLEVWGYDKNYIRNKVHELLNLVDLEDKHNNMPRELSGGQKQRVAIARALALEPKILLCDEATSALDPKTTKSILQLLRKINKKLDITIVIVTHQMEVIKEVCNKVVVMEAGEIRDAGMVEDLFVNPNNQLKSLLCEEEILPKNGVNIKLFFTEDVSEKCVITSMARELDIDFSIVWGKLEKFRDDVLGSLIINIDKKDEDKILKYLSTKSITCEIVHDNSINTANKGGEK